MRQLLYFLFQRQAERAWGSEPLSGVAQLLSTFILDLSRSSTSFNFNDIKLVFYFQDRYVR